MRSPLLEKTWLRLGLIAVHSVALLLAGPWMICVEADGSLSLEALGSGCCEEAGDVASERFSAPGASDSCRGCRDLSLGDRQDLDRPTSLRSEQAPQATPLTRPPTADPEPEFGSRMLDASGRVVREPPNSRATVLLL